MNCNEDIPAGGLARAEAQLPRAFADPAHCLYCVRDEILNNLLHLDLVSTNDWQALREAGTH